MPLWMILLYIVGIAVVVVVVAIAIFYAVTFVAIAFGFAAGVRSFGRYTRKADSESDLKREIRITKKIDAEEDRQLNRSRKRRFWNLIYRDEDTLPANTISQQAIQTPLKRIEMKKPRKNK